MSDMSVSASKHSNKLSRHRIDSFGKVLLSCYQTHASTEN